MIIPGFEPDFTNLEQVLSNRRPGRLPIYEHHIDAPFDLNLLVLDTPYRIFQTVLEQGARFREKAQGYGLGSGNSIPGYIPLDGYMAMIEAVKEIRRREAKIG